VKNTVKQLRSSSINTGVYSSVKARNEILQTTKYKNSDMIFQTRNGHDSMLKNHEVDKKPLFSIDE
jgi:hypothetical protein